MRKSEAHRVAIAVAWRVKTHRLHLRECRGRRVSLSASRRDRKRVPRPHAPAVAAAGAAAAETGGRGDGDEAGRGDLPVHAAGGDTPSREGVPLHVLPRQSEAALGTAFAAEAAAHLLLEAAPRVHLCTTN